MAKKYRLLRRVDPRTAATTVKNRWTEERARRLGDWTRAYETGVSTANITGFDNLAVWYESLMMERGTIAGAFKRIKEEYLRKLGITVAPRPTAPTIPA
jgi:hypothetical protein